LFAPAGALLRQELDGKGGARATVRPADLFERLVRLRNAEVGHGAQVFTVAFTPGGRRLATASADHTVRVWDAATGALLATLRGHRADVYTVAFAPDGGGRWPLAAATRRSRSGPRLTSPARSARLRR
jgi:WD40 repeat protein